MSSMERIAATSWLSGGVAGLIGAVGFGVVLQFGTRPPILKMVVPAIYGIAGPELVLGWVLHLFHGAVLGIVFFHGAELALIERRCSKIEHWIVAGVVYGLMVWAGCAVVLLPLWLQFIDFGGSPSFPNLALMGPFGHLIFGSLLGTLAWYFD